MSLTRVHYELYTRRLCRLDSNTTHLVSLYLLNFRWIRIKLCNEVRNYLIIYFVVSYIGDLASCSNLVLIRAWSLFTWSGQVQGRLLLQLSIQSSCTIWSDVSVGLWVGFFSSSRWAVSVSTAAQLIRIQVKWPLFTSHSIIVFIYLGVALMCATCS